MKGIEIGQKFGKWTVIAFAGSGHVIAKCDCGNERTRQISSIRLGGSKSCGCRHSELSARRIAAMDVNGRVFGRLTAIEHAGSSANNSILWKCVCQCGTECIVQLARLRSGGTQSCGCYAADVKKVAKVTHGHSANGMTSETYQTWAAMKARCETPSNPAYDRYGGRGIRICERWSEFENFLADMGERPDGLTIDRIDNDKGYEPGNCYWATPTQQARNTRQTVFMVYEGERIALADLAERFGLKPSVLRYRIKKGWSLEEALRRPVQSNTSRGTNERFQEL